MIEDRLLVARFKRGSQTALQRIYLKYRAYLLTLATALLNDVNTAEDVVHDFFVSFAKSGPKLKLEGSLKWFLVTCVMNLARDRLRVRKRQPACLDDSVSIPSNTRGPISSAVLNEEMQFLAQALAQLPDEQREVIVLHTRGQTKFKAIAQLQKVSIKTVQSRYRYGLDKLRVILNGEATR